MLVSGEVGTLARTLSAPARATLQHAYRTGFTSALASILVIAGLVAATGASLAFALVRGRDFVSSGEPAPAGGQEPAGAVAG